MDPFVDKSDVIEEAKRNKLSSSALPPPPNHPISDGLPETIDNDSMKNDQKVSFAEPTEAIDVQIVGPNDPANDPLEDAIGTIPINRSSIDDSRLPAPDQ